MRFDWVLLRVYRGAFYVHIGLFHTTLKLAGLFSRYRGLCYVFVGFFHVFIRLFYVYINLFHTSDEWLSNWLASLADIERSVTYLWDSFADTGFFCGYRGRCFVCMGPSISTEDLYLPKELHEHIKEPSTSTEDLYLPHIYRYRRE